MKTFFGRIFAVSLAFLCVQVDVSQGADINFYDNEGNVFTLTLKGTSCYNFKPKWEKKATAVDIEEGCFTLFQDTYCEGEKVSLGAGNHELKALEHDEKISSVRLCSPKDEPNAIPGVTRPPPPAGGEGEEMGGANFALQEVWDAAVEEHNKYRRIHGVPDVKGNEDMHRDSQSWADRLAKNHEFKSTTMDKYGNNLASSFRRTKVEAVRDAIKRWYDKIKHYDYERPGYNVDGVHTGSFSAIVWKSTTDIGVGIAWDEQEESWIINVFYSPPAMRSGFKENVLPPRNEEGGGGGTAAPPPAEEGAAEKRRRRRK